MQTNNLRFVSDVTPLAAIIEDSKNNFERQDCTRIRRRLQSNLKP